MSDDCCRAARREALEEAAKVAESVCSLGGECDDDECIENNPHDAPFAIRAILASEPEAPKGEKPKSFCGSCGKQQRSLCAACSGHFEMKRELEETKEALDSKHEAYRRLYALWLRVAHAMTPAGGPDITDEQVAERAERYAAPTPNYREEVERLKAKVQKNNEEFVSVYSDQCRAELERDEARAQLATYRQALEDIELRGKQHRETGDNTRPALINRLNQLCSVARAALSGQATAEEGKGERLSAPEVQASWDRLRERARTEHGVDLGAVRFVTCDRCGETKPRELIGLHSASGINHCIIPCADAYATPDTKPQKGAGEFDCPRCGAEYVTAAHAQFCPRATPQEEPESEEARLRREDPIKWASLYGSGIVRVSDHPAACAHHAAQGFQCCLCAPESPKDNEP